MRFGRSILFILILTALTLLLAEGALRVYFALAPTPANSTFVPDPDSGYRLRPGPFWEDDRVPGSPRLNLPVDFGTGKESSGP